MMTKSVLSPNFSPSAQANIKIARADIHHTIHPKHAVPCVICGRPSVLLHRSRRGATLTVPGGGDGGGESSSTISAIMSQIRDAPTCPLHNPIYNTSMCVMCSEPIIVHPYIAVNGQFAHAYHVKCSMCNKKLDVGVVDVALCNHNHMPEFMQKNNGDMSSPWHLYVDKMYCKQCYATMRYGGDGDGQYDIMTDVSLCY